MKKINLIYKVLKGEILSPLWYFFISQLNFIKYKTIKYVALFISLYIALFVLLCCFEYTLHFIQSSLVFACKPHNFLASCETLERVYFLKAVSFDVLHPIKYLFFAFFPFYICIFTEIFIFFAVIFGIQLTLYIAFPYILKIPSYIDNITNSIKEKALKYEPEAEKQDLNFKINKAKSANRKGLKI